LKSADIFSSSKTLIGLGVEAQTASRKKFLQICHHDERG
jgi:hypothetical protein